MKITHRFASAAAAGLLGAAALVAAPGVANAADPCMIGWSNTGPRSCVATDVWIAPVWTLGNGICAGMLRASGNAFDGPLWQYSEAAGAVHSVELNIAQGYAPLGEWAPTFLACDVTAIVDWQNLDTGQSGSASWYVPASQPSFSPKTVYVNTGPGRVRLTMRTDHPNIPVSTEVVVP